MRIIPVIDLWNSQTVHAVKGERKHYKPVQSILCASSDPVEIASAFRKRLGLNEIYIADLNAIRHADSVRHRSIVKTLCSWENTDILLDAGIADPRSATFWMETGIRKVVIGSETLTSLEDLEKIAKAIGQQRVAFSLDTRNGKTLSKCRELVDLSPLHALERIHNLGFREVLLLDLSRVGSGYGANLPLTAEVRARFPEMIVLVGGGITGIEEMKTIQSLGVGGVLVATVLHQGIVGTEHLSRLR
jgi:phosphoribosylformimino-5-aminoimidazole carboxamide ribotide isomerase